MCGGGGGGGALPHGHQRVKFNVNSLDLYIQILQELSPLILNANAKRRST